MPNDRLTVGAFLDRWLNVNIPGTVAESTEDDYNDTVRLHLRPALRNKRLTRPTVAELDKRLAAAPVVKDLQVLKQGIGQFEAGAPAPPVQQLRLDPPPEGLDRRIVVAVPDRTHRRQ